MNHLFEQFRRHIPGAGARFLELPDGAIVTYGDMLARSARLANALAARGVKPGDRVAVQVEKCPGALMLYLACVRAGAVFLPLNVAYTLAELDYSGAETCRRFAATRFNADGMKRIYPGVACRSSDGTWAVPGEQDRASAELP